ncbi:MAG: hypothetical protein ACTSQZ_01855, partial [Candidatus Thorarchaeota archaeon]
IAQTFTSTKILVDESHTALASDMWTPGNASSFGWILMENGYNVSMNFDESLDSGILGDYGILCLFFPMIELTSSEVDAVLAFVDAGGGLLLVGTEHQTSMWNYNSIQLNPISETYGITFNPDKWLGRSLRSDGAITNHQITTDVSSIHSNNDNFAGCTLTVTGSAQVLATANGNDVVAIAESGTGRVVAVGASAPFMIYEGDSWTTNANDHFQFTLNVIDWLAGNDQRVVDPADKRIFRLTSGSHLSSSEIEEYQMFSGVYHDHTTASDGQDSPTAMANRALEIALDWFIIADHSYNSAGSNGIYGALAARAHQQRYNLATRIFIGAELSSIPHTVGFPLTENIYTTNTQVAVDEIHDQGGFAVFCHPTIGPTYAPVWENFDGYGYDAFEVVNKMFFHGTGETAFDRPFIGASDGHSARILGITRNTIFVQNPTGPDGTVSVDDIVDAIENRRIVVTSQYMGLIFGDDIWVDRYLEVWEEAETAIEDADTQLTSLESSGDNVTLARLYLAEAENALDWWNPGRALQLVTDAVSEVILGIDIVPVTANLGTPTPGSDVTLSLRLTNTHDYAVELNVTPFIKTAVSFNEDSQILSAGPHSSTVIDFVGSADSKGYTHVKLNMRDLNTPYVPMPITLSLGGMIGNISTAIEEVDTGYNVTIKLEQNRGDSSQIESVSIEYNDGSGLETAPLMMTIDGASIELGPYPIGHNVTYTITMLDIYGNTFVFIGEVMIQEAAPIVDPVPDVTLLVIVGVGIAGLVVVVFIMKTKMGSSP